MNRECFSVLCSNPLILANELYIKILNNTKLNDKKSSFSEICLLNEQIPQLTGIFVNIVSVQLIRANRPASSIITATRSRPLAINVFIKTNVK